MIIKKTAVKITEILAFAKQVSENTDWSLQDAIAKLIEEQGELSEALMVEAGRLPHKSLSEDSYCEIADVIIQVCDVVRGINIRIKSQDILLDDFKINGLSEGTVFKNESDRVRYFISDIVPAISQLIKCASVGGSIDSTEVVELKPRDKANLINSFNECIAKLVCLSGNEELEAEQLFNNLTRKLGKWEVIQETTEA